MNLFRYDVITKKYIGDLQVDDASSYIGTPGFTTAPCENESWRYDESIDDWVEVSLPSLALVASENTLSGLPADAVIYSSGVSYSVGGGVATFDATKSFLVHVTSGVANIEPKLYEITPALAVLKANAIYKLEGVVKATREKFITITPGQEITYSSKLTDAKTYDATGLIGTWLQAEMNATGMTATMASQYIQETAEAWAPIGALIEETRRLCKIQIAAAASKASIVLALSSAIDDLEAI
jgi:prophage DNA circulation protein